MKDLRVRASSESENESMDYPRDRLVLWTRDRIHPRS